MTQKSVKLTLDVCPSANVYWRHDRGRTHRSPAANAYRDYVCLLCATMDIEPLDGDLSVRVAFYRRAKRYDLDNIFKQLFDSLQAAGVFHNDSQIAEIHATRHEDKHCPRVEITIEPIGAIA